MSTLAVGTIKSVSSAAPVIQNTSGSEIGFFVKAWLKMYWNSGTPTISGSGNVSSLTDVSTGDFTMNLTNALTDANHATLVSGDAYGQSSAPHFNVGFTTRGYTTNAITINATNFSGTSTDIKSVQVAVVR